MALHDGPGTSFELAVSTNLPLKQVAPTLNALHKEKRIHRSAEKLRLRPRSPGAYLYSLEALNVR